MARLAPAYKGHPVQRQLTGWFSLLLQAEDLQLVRPKGGLSHSMGPQCNTEVPSRPELEDLAWRAYCARAGSKGRTHLAGRLRCESAAALFRHWAETATWREMRVRCRCLCFAFALP